VAFSRLALGSVYRAGRRDFEAIETMRPGLAIVRGELDRAPGVGLDRLLPFLAAAHAEGARDPAKRAALAAEMFAASQLVRGGVTARSIAQAAARHASDDPEIADLVARAQAAVRHRDRLRLDLGRAAVSLNGKPDPKRIRRLRDGYAAATRAAAALQQELTAAFPEYSDLVASPPVAAAQLQALLRPDEALVRFVVGDAGGFVFVVRGDAVTAAPLAITRAEMEAAVRKLRAPFETAGRRIAAFDLAAAHALYRALFGPIEDRLAGVRHLIAVSSGALLSLPLALLTTQPPAAVGATDYRSAAWLARAMAVSVLPSVRALVSLRTVVRPSAAPLPFIGFGDPAFAGRAGDGGMDRLARECRLGTPVAPGLIRRLAALPETAEELRRVARVLGAGPEDLYLGADASEARLRRLAMDRYRVVYFATHGLLPGQLRCQSEPALALSPPPAAVSEREADGLLDATEIAGLRLDADLVVLSACNTGGGGSGRFGGESLSGLVRAFFQAGARSLIVSHWQVDSRATVALMTRLFERLAAARSLSPAEALRRAQLELIADPALAHPFFWAAFTFVGDGGRELSW
jgi:CHAT domain-containing protein